MMRFGRVSATLATIGAAMMVLLVLPAIAGSAAATPAPNPAGAPVQWAYGGERWVNVSVSFPNGSYQAHAFFGWHVIFTATNTSNTTVELEAQRTMAASFTAQYCSPGCANATTYGNLSVKGWERDTGFVNLTTTASVTENHNVGVAALGIANASAQSVGALNESLSYRFPTGGSSHSASASLRVAGHSQASIAFAPALGVVPWSVSPGDRWSSTSSFSAQGSWLVAWQAQRTGLGGATVSANGSTPGTVNASGNVTVFGTDLGNVTLANGQIVPVIALALVGPFDDVDGVILVPHAFGLFAGAHAAWAGHAMAVESVATEKLDLAIDPSHHHVRVVAAASDYTGQDSTLATMSSGVTVAAAPTSSPPPGSPTEVQGQPESVAQAQQASSCLIGACNPAKPGPSSSTFLVAAVIGLVVVTIVGTAGVLEYRAWSHRKGGWTAQTTQQELAAGRASIPAGPMLSPPSTPGIPPASGRPPQG